VRPIFYRMAARAARAFTRLRYGTLLVDALDLDRMPRALDRVLAHVRG
jgi:hypothetical protein